MNPLLGKVVGSFAGGLFGQLGEKVGSWIPNSRQHKRKQIRKIQDEIKMVSKWPNNTDTRAKLAVLTHRLSDYQKELAEE